MSIDRQRVAAVELLTAWGLTWNGRAWSGSSDGGSLVEAADRMHALLMDRAAVLAGATEGAGEECELSEIGNALEGYESARRSVSDDKGAR